MVDWFMVFNFQQYFSYIVAVSFIVGGTGETTDLSQATDKLYHIKCCIKYTSSEQDSNSQR